MSCDEAGCGIVAGVRADLFGHVDREEVARRQKAVDRFQADVVSVNEVRSVPGKRRTAESASARTSPGLLPTIVCSRCDLSKRAQSAPCFRARIRSLELCDSLVGETVAHPDRILG